MLSWGICRVVFRVGCRVAVLLRLEEALPLFERFDHTVLAMLWAFVFCRVSFGATLVSTVVSCPVRGVGREHSVFGGVRVGAAGLESL